MKTVPAGQFKAQCLGMLDEVAKTHEAIVVTKYGKPVARVVPCVADRGVESSPLKGTVVFEKNIIDPVEVEWETGL